MNTKQEPREWDSDREQKGGTGRCISICRAIISETKSHLHLISSTEGWPSHRLSPPHDPAANPPHGAPPHQAPRSAAARAQLYEQLAPAAAPPRAPGARSRKQRRLILEPGAKSNRAAQRYNAVGLAALSTSRRAERTPAPGLELGWLWHAHARSRLSGLAHLEDARSTGLGGGDELGV